MPDTTGRSYRESGRKLEIMYKNSMTDEQFCKVLGEQYAAWDPGKKVLFLECMSHSLTMTIRSLCNNPDGDKERKIESIGLLNELLHHIPQAVRDILFSIGTIDGSWFCPGEALLGYARAYSLKEGAIQGFVGQVICDANFRIVAVANDEKDESGSTRKTEPVLRGLTQIDTSVLKIRQNPWS